MINNKRTRTLGAPKEKRKGEKKALEQVSGQILSNLGSPQGPLRLWHAANYVQTKLLQIKTRFLDIFPPKSVFFLPQKANQNSSLLNLLPFVKVCLLYLNIPHRSWTRGHGPAKLNLLPFA